MSSKLCSRFKSYELLRHVNWQIVTDVSEEPAASIFTIQQFKNNRLLNSSRRSLGAKMWNVWPCQMEARFYEKSVDYTVFRSTQGNIPFYTG
jgi:hypothetical protein